MHPILIDTPYIVIPTYLFLISLSYCIGVVWVSKRARDREMDYKLSLDIALAFMFGSLLGARLLHVVYERPDIYLADPVRVFEIWKGGFVFYGGAILSTLFCFLLIRKRGADFLTWADLYTPVFPLGYGLGRLGCFFAGCCFGRECDLPWAVHFPEGVEAPAHVGLHPTQLYAAFFEWAVFAFILYLERRRPSKGVLFFTWLTFHGIGRVMMEYFRADFRGASPLGLSVSTWISLGVIAFGLAGLAKVRARAPAR
ncbi:MAG: prolipoprotein diacylglyceryl transferase [Bdellovibrionia bacterium]